MNTTSTPSLPPKTSKVKQAAWSAILYAVVVISNLILIAKSQMVFTAEDYSAAVPLPFIITGIPLVLLILVVILKVTQTKNTVQDDELSQLNRYKAGYYSRYIFLVIILIGILCIRDFRFAFTEDPVDNIFRPSLLLLGLEQLLENLVFIVIEKRGLE